MDKSHAWLTRYRGLLVLTLSIAPLLAHAEPATIVDDTPLLQRPSYGATQLDKIEAGSRVELLQRSAGWKKIEYRNSSGWVRSYQVRSGIIESTADESSAGGFFSGLASLSRKASGLFSSKRKDYSFQRTATIGVRGLSEEEIKKAAPDYAQMDKMETFRSSKKSARKFAKKGGRKAIKLAHMPKSSAEK